MTDTNDAQYHYRFYLGRMQRVAIEKFTEKLVKFKGDGNSASDYRSQMARDQVCPSPEAARDRYLADIQRQIDGLQADKEHCLTYWQFQDDRHWSK